MKILLVGNYLNDRQESMLRFSGVMHRGLCDSGLEVRVCRPPSVAGRVVPSEHGVGKWLGYVDKFVTFPPLLRKLARWADVVHFCDHSNAMYVRYIGKRPNVVTCHDLLGIREAMMNRTRWTGRQLQRMILAGLGRAQHIACVSESTRRDLLRFTKVPADRVSRIYNGLNYPYRPMPAAEAELRLQTLGLDTAKPFILHVGGNAWYKNREGVLRIFQALMQRSGTNGINLVMAGKPWTEGMKALALGAGLSGNTMELLTPSNQDLRALYSTARIMLFPSVEEGFGWPILEAQACGCVVVTTNRSPMNEVGGPAAVYINPEDIQGAADVVAELLASTDCRRKQSLENATRFSTADMLNAYIGLYRKVANEYS